MKTLSAGMQTHVAQRVLTLAFGMRVERADGDITGWTDHPTAKTVTVLGDSLTLEPTNAVNISSIARSMGMGVDNLEAEVVAFDDVMTKIGLLEGRWDGARFYIFQYNFVTPSDGLIPWISGKFGNMRPKLGSYVIELRDLRQELQNDTTRVLQANCDYRLGDDNCTVDLGPYTFTGTVSAVDSNRQFTDASLAAADADYFTEGEVEWLTGLSAGLRFKVYTHATGGVFTLDRAALRAIDVGDTFSVIAGCMKRRIDCRDKFDNVLNYPGLDTAPTTDAIVSRSPETPRGVIGAWMELAGSNPPAPTGGSAPAHFGGDEWYYASPYVTWTGQRGDQQTNGKSWSPYGVSALGTTPSNSSGADGSYNIKAVADPLDATKAAILTRLQEADADTGGSGNSRTMLRYLGDASSTPAWPERGGSDASRITLQLRQQYTVAFSVLVPQAMYDYCDTTEPTMRNVIWQVHDNSLGDDPLSPNIEILLCGSSDTAYGKAAGDVGIAMCVRGNPTDPLYTGSGAGDGGTQTSLGEVITVTPDTWLHFLLVFTLDYDTDASTEVWTATGAGSWTKVVDSTAINAFKSDAAGYGDSYDHYWTFGQYIFTSSLLNTGAKLDLYWKDVVISDPGYVPNVATVQAYIQAR